MAGGWSVRQDAGQVGVVAGAGGGRWTSEVSWVLWEVKEEQRDARAGQGIGNFFRKSRHANKF